MKKVNMHLPFMQKLKNRLNNFLQRIRQKDDDSFDNPYLIF